ncbi:MAG TPA: Crp/Fnr family transcriptional regulator [Pyrinomonadaceae bacterium]|nr:Crp/Fnr family transcriptional regulator [Pyrinomonadaceae bacterium]
MNRNIIQLAGTGHRIEISIVRKEFYRAGTFQRQVLNFTRALMSQMSQTALCNRLHSAEKRLAKWLVSCHDRSTSDVLDLTQEFVALMLGSNRVTLTTAAGQLQDGGAIKYKRGQITVIDRDILESLSCTCYSRIKSSYDAVALDPEIAWLQDSITDA